MKALTLALQHLPLILKAVVDIEAVIGAGKGQTKKQLLLDAVAVGAKAAGESPEAHVAMVGGLADAIVGTLNASGVFAKK